MTRRRAVVCILFCSALSLGLGMALGKHVGVPFLFYGKEYSIGIYSGPDPFHMTGAAGAANPVLTYKNVTDVDAAFVADPFMVRDNGTWHMFFEVWNNRSGQGDIGLATSVDGIRWEYRRIVLDEPFHLSYPCVFKAGGEYYLIPESAEAYSVRLYRAARFPDRWEFAGKLLTGNFKDPSIVFRDGTWYLFAESSCGQGILRLFSSKSLTGPWTEHPKSPVVYKDLRTARPGGRVTAVGNDLYRFAQDGFPSYGRQTRAFRIKVLTATDYLEEEIPESPLFKASGKGWNSDGMHHVDPHRIGEGKWIACVDGLRKPLRIGFGR